MPQHEHGWWYKKYGCTNGKVTDFYIFLWTKFSRVKCRTWILSFVSEVSDPNFLRELFAIISLAVTFPCSKRGSKALFGFSSLSSTRRFSSNDLIFLFRWFCSSEGSVWKMSFLGGRSSGGSIWINSRLWNKWNQRIEKGESLLHFMHLQSFNLKKSIF